MESMLLFRLLREAQFATITREHTQLFFWQCDAHYRFTLVDIGDAVCHSNGGVLSNSVFGQAIESETLAIPVPRVLLGTSTVV